MKIIYYTENRWEPIPLWMGIAYSDPARLNYLVAPLGVNWLIALTFFIAACLRHPKFLFSLLRLDEHVRLYAMEHRLYRVEMDLHREKTLNKRLTERNEALEKILSSTIHDNLDKPNVRKV